MSEALMSISSQSPDHVLEKYTISSANPSIGFESGNNVVLNMKLSTNELSKGRDRDSSNVHTKTIMDHRGNVDQLQGRVITTHQGLIGFRSFNENIGDTVNLINFQTKMRFRFKELNDNVAIDIAFAQHHKFIAILDDESSLYVYEIEDDGEIHKYLTISNWPSRSTRDSTERPRLSWCPFVPGEDDEEEDDIVHMLAVFAGRHMHILNLGVLKDSDNGGNDFDFEGAKNVEGAVFSLTLDDEPESPDVHIAAVAISPDSTAVAIAKSTGSVVFYVINEDDNGLKLAHTFDPNFEKSAPITDLIFLDDLTPNRKDIQFWRFCVAVSNHGRSIGLFECREWKCLGRICFEDDTDPNNVHDFLPIVDPTANFIHFMDTVRNNLFSVEISNPLESNKLARFVGVTQTSFCHPIYAIANITANTFENSDESVDDIFQNDEESDDEDSSKEEKKNKKVKRYFVAISKKSMVELQVTLKQQPPRVGSIKSDETSRKHVKNSSESASSNSDSKYGDDAELIASNNNRVKIGYVDPRQEQVYSDIDGIKKHLMEMSLKLNSLEIQKNDHLQQVLDKFQDLDSSLHQREGYILNRVEQMCETVRLDTLAALRNGLASVHAGVEQSIRNANGETSEYVAQRVGSTVRSALQETVAPTFERSCDVLFDRLNEQFKNGLGEYLSNVNQAISNAAVAAVQLAVQQQVQLPNINSQFEMDKMSLYQLLQSAPELAFETALNKGDSRLLEFVCSKVNPDVLFTPRTVLSQPILLSLLQQLTMSLNHERDLKYRYIELILPSIDVKDPEISQIAQNVATQLLTVLQDIIKKSTDEQVRRYTRLLFQLTRSTFFQSPHIHSGPQHSPM